MSTSALLQHDLNGYYRWHSRVYDLTRWAFLFGRQQLIDLAATHQPAPTRILEIGCGTGRNLVALAEKFPKARITGLDLSTDMLDRASPKLHPYGDRVTLLHQAYTSPIGEEHDGFDLIVLSYALTMINPGHDQVLHACQKDLASKGILAVVDFHSSSHSWFRQWMSVNHVRMEGQVQAHLQKHFHIQQQHLHSAYASLWHYGLFIGRC